MPARTLILLDEDTSCELPLGIPVQSVGTQYDVCDNFGLGKTATVSGQFPGGISSVMVSGNPGWIMSFVWLGTFYAARP